MDDFTPPLSDEAIRYGASLSGQKLTKMTDADLESAIRRALDVPADEFPKAISTHDLRHIAVHRLASLRCGQAEDRDGHTDAGYDASMVGQGHSLHEARSRTERRAVLLVLLSAARRNAIESIARCQ